MAKDALVESAQAFKVGLLEFLTTRGMGVAAELLKTPVWIFLAPGTRAGIHAGGNDRGGTVEALHCLAVYPPTLNSQQYRLLQQLQRFQLVQPAGACFACQRLDQRLGYRFDTLKVFEAGHGS
jgi:hypothetical protein